MRIVFMGTPAFAVPTLERLRTEGHEVVAVYTQPPRPAGRGKQLQPSPVQRAAEAAGLEVRCPARLREADEQARFAALDADVAVVAAYGLILPRAVLEAPRLGCLNVHASLLPRWRGAAPIQRAILAGDTVTGVTIMQMEQGLDTGPMLARAATPIADKTTGALTEELATLGAGLMAQVLADPRGFAPVMQNDAEATLAPKVIKSEARIDWTATACQIERQVRAFAPAPGAWFEHEGERFRILRAETLEAAGEAGTVMDEALTIACGEGAIRPLLVQRAGRPAMEPAALLRGRAIPPGTRLR
ncbi:methionyl-tRNA formyltransferase [Erythrobacteraceae bacterium CFH 75059]|uniref:methionyl-tRNA formyltransferase n=1 Tax=Qipengyuania thermophila TaxID=2509361 RepID=UPI00101F7D97|nr:methionyl-tRNA formyltransferase [Qipengyuania thermophila]TCD02281.1 methionyl-tRNA formyltransferase [Erythrobacteraceae bacterium CFH 75059]